MPPKLDEIIAELADSDRQERIELLIDLSRNLPPLPDRLVAHKDGAHRVEECQSPVYLFVEVNGGRVALFADVPVEAPTVRGFVAMLVEGLDNATVEEVLALPGDLLQRCGMAEILGMQRLGGLNGVIRRLKLDVGRVATAHARIDRDASPN